MNIWRMCLIIIPAAGGWPAHLATAENGTIWSAAAVVEKAAHVAEIIEQRQHRNARRQERKQREGLHYVEVREND
jgi:hypothetical protein